MWRDRGSVTPLIDMDADLNTPDGLTSEDTQSPAVGVPGVTFTVREAAKACAVHANTVRRRLKGGEFPNAYRDATGTWRIPVVDLEAAGLRPNRFGSNAPAEPVVVIPEAGPADVHLLREAYDAVKILEAEADTLRNEVAALAQRAAFAETLANERADRIQDLRVALRALESVNPRPEDRFPAASPAPAAAEHDVWTAQGQPPTRRARWFRRSN